MVATTRCSQIQQDQLDGLKNDIAWEALLKEGKQKLLDDFGERMSSLVDSCITGYFHFLPFFQDLFMQL